MLVLVLWISKEELDTVYTENLPCVKVTKILNDFKELSPVLVEEVLVEEVGEGGVLVGV